MYLSILQRYTKNNILTNDFLNLNFPDDIYCISLSGGVDSMVLLDILKQRGKKIIAIHFNYNNRSESILEEEFLENYCKSKNIIFHKYSFNFSRGSINRNKYEQLTKQIRFEIYKKILKEHNLKYILLGHHKDDIIENIFSNFCKGENYLNLSVIKNKSIILDVNIFRPLIDYYKKDIYEYAHYYEIPYFKDTTPLWSVRGKFRNNILPILLDTFTGLKQNLLNLAKESNEWNILIHEKIINKYMNNIKYNICPIFVEMPIDEYYDYPLCFWYIIFSKIYHKYNKNAPTRKSLEILVYYLNNKENYKILLKDNITAIIKNNNIILQFN